MPEPEGFADARKPKESRQARARRLQPVVARWVAACGARYVAERTGLGQRAIERFARDEVVPQPGALDAFDELAAAGDPPELPGRRRRTGGPLSVSGGG
jgi:hypothetical protein